MIKHINTNEFNDLVLNTKGIKIVDFYAVWCRPCNAFSEIFEEMSYQRDNISFYKVDVDKEEELMYKYNINSIPSVMIFIDDKAVNKYIGFMDFDEFSEWIDDNIKDENNE